jgi:hypothetical protein
MSQTIPLGHQAAPHCMYAFHPHGALLVVLVGLIWTTRNLKKKVAKALAEFKFCCLGEHFYGTKRL